MLTTPILLDHGHVVGELDLRIHGPFLEQLSRAICTVIHEQAIQNPTNRDSASMSCNW
jgi:hypothetical protein